MSIRVLTGLCVVLLLGISLFVQTVSANQADDVKFSVTVWDQTLEEVLSDIEQSTGLTLLVDSNITSVPLSGVYNNVTVCEFFYYAVQENNISVSADPEQKIVTVSQTRPSQINPGDSHACEMESIAQEQHSVDMPSDNEMRALETDQTDPLTGTTWSEAEEQTNSSGHESKSSQLSQAEFLASESDYIAKAKKAKSEQPRTIDEVEIDISNKVSDSRSAAEKVFSAYDFERTLSNNINTPVEKEFAAEDFFDLLSKQSFENENKIFSEDDFYSALSKSYRNEKDKYFSQEDYRRILNRQTNKREEKIFSSDDFEAVKNSSFGLF